MFGRVTVPHHYMCNSFDNKCIKSDQFFLLKFEEKKKLTERRFVCAGARHVVYKNSGGTQA